MFTRQTILIIGTGEAGSWIATNLSGGNYHVLLCDKEFNKAHTLAEELQAKHPFYDVEAMECSYNGAWEADVIIIATPCHEQKQVVSYIKDVVNQKIVVSLCDKDEITVTEELQQLLPHTKIINVQSNKWVHSSEDAQHVFVGGKNTEAVDTVSAMLRPAEIEHAVPKSLFS